MLDIPEEKAMTDDPLMDPGLPPDIVDVGGFEITVTETEAPLIAATPHAPDPGVRGRRSAGRRSES